MYRVLESNYLCAVISLLWTNKCPCLQKMIGSTSLLRLLQKKSNINIYYNNLHKIWVVLKLRLLAWLAGSLVITLFIWYLNEESSNWISLVILAFFRGGFPPTNSIIFHDIVLLPLFQAASISAFPYVHFLFLDQD